MKTTDILLVDDVPANLIALEAVLKSPDYTLVTANNGTEAIDLVSRRDFAVILLDVNMPGIDGYETARRIKQLDRGRDVPIIFVTATYQNDPFVKRGYEAGAIDYFGKPFDPDVLKTKVGIYANLYLRTHKLREKEVELIRTQTVLAEQRKLSTLLETLAEGVIIADKDGRIVQMNERAKKIWGDGRYIDLDEYDQYIGWNGDGERLKGREWGIARAILNGETCCRERVRIQCFDGSKKVIVNSSSPLLDENGEVIGAVSVFDEVTQPKDM